MRLHTGKIFLKNELDTPKFKRRSKISQTKNGVMTIA
jgi:hypothetical protein